MTISDIITILSLVIAIIAIINEKQRKHLLLKYGWIDIIFYSLIFIAINYFVFYNEFFGKGLYLDFLYFENFGLNNPKHYAYILSLSSLLLILFKINYKHYPSWKLNDVIRYYKSRIENNDGNALLDLIENYHSNDIGKSINSTKNYNPDSNDWMFERFHRPTIKEKIQSTYRNIIKNIFPFSRINRFNYARVVLFNVVNDPALITLTSNKRPYFYAKIISEFKKEKRTSFPTDFTNQFLDEIVKSKNFWLIKELKQSDNFDTGQPESYFFENKLIASLIQDVSVADVNEIWRPFGENAIKEIENEFNLGQKSRLLNKYRNDDVLWEYCTHISIKFFNILIIEAIVQGYTGCHFWLFYYWHITQKIFTNLENFLPVDFEENETNYHHLILEMNDFIIHWLNLSNDKESQGIFHDILNCLGEQIHETMKSEQFGEQRKKDLLDRILRVYCNFDEKEKTSEIRTKLEEILIKPCMLTNADHPYYGYINEVWEEFDKIPHRGYANNTDYAYFARLKENVIVPLGLNPDAY